MIIVNLNIRGLGGGTKANYIRHIIAKEGRIYCAFRRLKHLLFQTLDAFRYGVIIRLDGFTMKA